MANLLVNLATPTATMASCSFLPPFNKPTVGISYLLFFFLLIVALLSTGGRASSHPTKPSYTQHCNSLVPESISTGVELSSFIQLDGAYFNGGHQIFSASQSPDTRLYLYPSSIYKTQREGVIQIYATLRMYNEKAFYGVRNASTARSRRAFRDGVLLQLHGFWSESVGMLCMVGSGYGLPNEDTSLQLSTVFKLNYPKASNISTSIVTGTLESTDLPENPNHFDTISILGFAQKSYSYTLVPDTESGCKKDDESGLKTRSLEPGTNICLMLSSLGDKQFELDYGGDCNSRRCSPFDGFLPSLMIVGGVQCSEKGRMRMYLRFANSSDVPYKVPLIPETSLVGEGVWDEKKNQLCFAACRLRKSKESTNLTETYVEDDCSVGLNLKFPKVLSLKRRSNGIGSLWSKRKENEPGYFNQIKFQSVIGRVSRSSISIGRRGSVSDLEYEYSELGMIRNSCRKKNVEVAGKRFPDGNSFDDMDFHVHVDTKWGWAWGMAAPLSIGQAFNDPFFSMPSIPQSNSSNHSLLNVSYSMAISFSSFNASMKEKVGLLISAEGVYDAETGMLCMVGCKRSSENITMDCSILIDIEFAPFNSETGQQLNGTIQSTRNKADPLYMEPMQFSTHNYYTKEAKETIWRMNLEIVMLLISLTLAGVFIRRQLLYVKKNRAVLPSMSLLMLVIITLGYMVPLVLNFEAFLIRDRSRDLIWSGRWVESTEVVVRVVTMIVFLLQFRLLQLAFSARLDQGSKEVFWTAEKKAIGLCLILYLVGGLIAWFVHWKKSTLVAVGSERSFWEDLRSFAGLILDGFLLPQILLNLFSNSSERVLAPSFYVGTTLVRLVPHAYDAYRAHMRLPYVKTSYIYADPDGDLYSAAWDVVIPCGGLLFAILIYLQQRLGGAFFLPQRFRQSAKYQVVSLFGE